MSEAIDLSNLRSMTDGDTDLERALFEEFIASFEQGIEALRANREAETSEIWRREAHAMKGISVNLGAEQLGHLCKQGQENYQQDSAFKSELLQQIEAEYARAKQFLLATMEQF